MRRHAKASTAGSNEGNGKSRGLFGRVFAVRGASSDSKGSGAPKAKLALAFGGALILILAIGVTLASAVVPTLTIEDAKEVSYTSALAKGTVDPQGKETYCHFEYISQAQLNENVGNGLGEFEFASGADCNGNPHEGSGAQNVEAQIGGLAPSTVYHLRLVASNEDGQSEAVAADTFETEAVAKPTVTINPVTTFTGTTAHFTGTINPNAPSGEPAGKPDAFDVSWHFQCSPDCPGAEGSLQAGNTPQGVTADATGLEPNTNYEVTLVAFNAGGSESAGPVSFKTTAVGPAARTFPAFALGNGTEALVGGKVNPRNSQTEYWIEYGPGSGVTYPSSIPATKDAPAGSGGQAVFVAQTITGLSPAAKYHFRLVAKNATGTTPGEDVSFETPPPAEPIQSNCPNAKLRTETDSAALPECRAYEMTTFPDKNGNDISYGTTSSSDGNRVAYVAQSGAFADAPANNQNGTYVAQRGASGWTTHSLVPRVGTPDLGYNAGYYPVDVSSDLSAGVLAPIENTAEEPLVVNILRVKSGSSPTWVTEPTVPGAEALEKDYAGRSADASHIFFESRQEFAPGVSGRQLWEWFEGKVSLVSAREDGSPFPEDVAAGAGLNGLTSGTTAYTGELPEQTTVSADGSRVFFGEGSGFQTHGVYVREDGLHTRALSVSQRTGSVGGFDNQAVFVGAAVDGSRIYMNSQTQLTNDAPPGGGLYSYNLETDAMHLIAPGVASDLEGRRVVLVSEDGTRVYFASTKVLVPGKGVEGAKNLYTANDEGGDLAFIGTVDPEDVAGLAALATYVNATPADGDYFAFASTARLTAYDNAGHREIYLYDAAAGSLRCVSCRPDGQAAEGDALIRPSTSDGGFDRGRPRVLSSDRSYVFFDTRDGLVPEDANGVSDVYEYHDGQVSLISTGTSAFNSQIVDNSPDGKNVFIMTRDPLVGQDIDGNQDIYDARVDGGFPPPPPPVSLCEGEACQGQAHGAPAYASPGTASLAGRGNTDGRTQEKTRKTCGRKAKKQHSKCGTKTKKHKAKKHQAKKTSKSGRGK